MGMSTAEKNRYWKAIKAGASHARARAIALGSRRNPDAPGADGSQVNAPDEPEEAAAPEAPSKPEKKGAKGSTSTRTEVRSPTSTRTEVRSPTSTRTEVRSPTSTGTSTKAHTSGNVTVTGGAGAGANTKVYISGKEGDRRITDVETSSPSTDQASHRSNPEAEHIPARDLRVGDSFWSACGRREKPEWWTITKLFGHDDRDHIRVEARNARTGKVVEDSMQAGGVAYAKRGSRSNPNSAAPKPVLQEFLFMVHKALRGAVTRNTRLNDDNDFVLAWDASIAAGKFYREGTLLKAEKRMMYALPSAYRAAIRSKDLMFRVDLDAAQIYMQAAGRHWGPASLRSRPNPGLGISNWRGPNDQGAHVFAQSIGGVNYHAEIHKSGGVWVWWVQFASGKDGFSGRVARGESATKDQAKRRAEFAIMGHVQQHEKRGNPSHPACPGVGPRHQHYQGKCFTDWNWGTGPSSRIAVKVWPAQALRAAVEPGSRAGWWVWSVHRTDVEGPNLKVGDARSSAAGKEAATRFVGSLQSENRSNPGYGDADFSFEWIAPDGARISAGDTVEYWRRTGLPHGAKPVRTVKKVLKMLVFRDHVQVNYSSFGDTVDASNYIRRVSKRTEV